MKHVISMVLMIIVASSCKKQQEIFEKQPMYTAKSAVMDNEAGENNSSGLLHLSSSSSVTSVGTWYIKQSYLDNYQHFYQIDANPEYPGSVLCGPTSYMLAGHMIATSKGIWYPSSKAKVGAIYNKLSQAGKFDDNQGMYISDLVWFCNTYDYPVIKTSYLRTASRDAMKEYLEYYIKSGYPVVATVNVYGLQGAYWDNDLDMTDQLGVKYYVSKNGPVGHYILLIGIKINADGSGRVWYKDPLSRTGDTRCASYTRILDAMKYNGNNDYYDAVAVFEGMFFFIPGLLEVSLRSFFECNIYFTIEQIQCFCTVI